MAKEFFTLYWLDGKRQVISGESIDTAFTAAGYDDGAIHAVDWYENGVTDSYRREGKHWVKREPIRIHEVGFPNHSVEALIAMLEKHHEVVIDYENKDKLIVKRSWGKYCDYGWIETIAVYFAEHCDYPYSEDSDEKEHWVVTGTQYYHPNDLTGAIECFMARFKTPVRSFSTATSVQFEDIASKQFNERPYI